MVKQLQRKLILIVMGTFFLVMVLIVGVLNGLNLHRVTANSDKVLKVLADNEGEIPDDDDTQKRDHYGIEFQVTSETAFETRYFCVYLNDEEEVISCNLNHIASIDEEEAVAYAEEIIADNKDENGSVGIYRYLVKETSNGTVVYFVDCYLEQQSALNVLVISIAVGLGSMILVFALVFFLSKRAIMPIIENMERQKQFVTDASHEIKTPLAIISANADVLELTMGEENEWVDGIRRQTKQLDGLIQNMLLLARMDEQKTEAASNIAFSKLITETMEPFKVLATQKNKNIIANIQNDVIINGIEMQWQRLISVLVDNAVKYAYEDTNIVVELTNSGKECQLKVKNHGDPITREQQELLFERFYRTDTSRSRKTGGYGIGLSIAKAIVEKNHGSIKAVMEDGMVCFMVRVKSI